MSQKFQADAMFQEPVQEGTEEDQQGISPCAVGCF